MNHAWAWLASATLGIVGAELAPAGDLLISKTGSVPDGPPSVRSRLVTIDTGAIPDWTGAIGADIGFNVWDGLVLRGRVDRAEPTEAGQILHGTLEGEDDSSFLIVSRENVIVADIRSPARGAWYVHPVDGATHAVRQINDQAFAPCATDDRHIRGPANADDPASGTEVSFDPRSVPEIAVMIVYTAQARSGAGGQAGIDALVDMAIAQANQCYSVSQINAKLKLVYRGLVNYTESGDANTDIYRLQDPQDGYIDEVHSIRDCVGADVVSMLVNNFNACGVGFLMCCGGYTGFADLAFNVVDKDCISNFSFAHEVGHNLGCHHDRDNAGGSPAFNYSYGFRTADQAYRTVMAYSPGTRIGYFSNPNITYQGRVLGVPAGQANAAYNALSINNTAPIAATFRSPACPSDIDQNCFVNGDDFDQFTVWFVAGDMRADYDGNTFVNGDDFDRFTTDFVAGC